MNVSSYLQSEQTLTLSKAVLLYESEAAAFATVHEVLLAAEGKSEPPTLGPGVCLTRDLLDQMILKMSGISRRRGILPPNTLCFDGGRMAWYVPPSKRPIFFKTSRKEFNKQMDGRLVWHPGLVFLAQPKVLTVVATLGDQPPIGTSEVFRAPYFNLYDLGNMCAGNSRIPDTVQLSERKIWEDAFFETNFTHSNLLRDQRLTIHPEGHDAMWKEASVRSRKAFDPSWLVPFNPPITLEDLVNR